MPGLPPSDLDFKAQDLEDGDREARGLDDPDPIPGAAPHAAVVVAPAMAVDAAPAVAGGGILHAAPNFDFGFPLGTATAEMEENFRVIVNNSPTIQGQSRIIRRDDLVAGLDCSEGSGRDVGLFDKDWKAVVISESIMAADPNTSGAGAAVLAHELQHAVNSPVNTHRVNQALRGVGNDASDDTAFVGTYLAIARRDEALAEIAAWGAFIDLAEKTQPRPLTEASLVAYGKDCMESYVEYRPDGTLGLTPELTRLMTPDRRIAVTEHNIAVMGRLFFDPPIAAHGTGAGEMDYPHRCAVQAIEKLERHGKHTVSLDFQRLGLTHETIIQGLRGEDGADSQLHIVNLNAAPRPSLTGDGPAVARPASLTPGLPLADPRSNGLSGVPRSFPSGSAADDPDRATVLRPPSGLGLGSAAVASAVAPENTGGVAGARDATSRVAGPPIWGAWLDPPGMGERATSSSGDIRRAYATGAMDAVGGYRAAIPDPWGGSAVAAPAAVDFTFPSQRANDTSPARITSSDNAASGASVVASQEGRPHVPVAPLTAPPAPSDEARPASDVFLVDGGNVRSGKRRIDTGTDDSFDRAKIARSDTALSASDAASTQAAAVLDASRRRTYMALYGQCLERLEPHAPTVGLNESECVSSAACLALAAAKKGIKQVDWVAPHPQRDRLYAGEGRQGDPAGVWVEAGVAEARKKSSAQALTEFMSMEPEQVRAVATQGPPSRAL
ncbi:XVIPCD domain-containing protein [Lysobacter capsici]|uniref:XVIPCD domain-containing protein n=1 Tax=Lysobacter capsici TaxID=435897 RepID=UPI001C0069E9|nr:XVIPCD domain-containing protein [Lysobacter capsici]QWF16957.1 hypothetical protein KME82_25040 [Lysobacter capsici]